MLVDGMMDAMTQPLYDTARINSGGRADLFTTCVGQGTTGFGSGVKHFGDTNMFLAGQLPAGFRFVIRSVFVEPIGEAWSESSLAGASLGLELGCKTYLRVPVVRARVSLVVTPDTIDGAFRLADALRSVAPSAAPMLLGMMPGIVIGFDLEDRRLAIRAVENFRVVLDAPDTAPHGGLVRVYLNGQLGRPTQ